MPYQFPPHIQQLVRELMTSGGYATVDELLEDALLALQQVEDDDYEAIQEALDEWQAGDQGIPLDEAFEKIRNSVRLPDDA